MSRINYKQLVQAGFTIVEMAIVLVIVGLLISGLLIPLGVQRDVRDYAQTRTELTEIRESLIGFALSHAATDGNPYLPCPDTDGDGNENRAAGICVNVSGVLPWVTLGLGQSDSWNNQYLYRVTSAYANSNLGFTLATEGTIAGTAARGNDIVNTIAVGGANIATNIPVVVVSKGKGGAGAADDEAENSDGDLTFVHKEQIDVSGNEFDDIVVWVPSTILVNRLVAAGQLP